MRNKCVFCKGDTDDAVWVTLSIEDEFVDGGWACRACGEKLWSGGMRGLQR